MIRHYLKTSIRFLYENKFFSAINLFGLSLALCIVYLTFIYLRFELSYDQFNEKVDQIHRISTDIKGATGTAKETSSAPLASALEQTFPEVEKAGHFLLDYYIVSKDQESFGEETIAYVDSSLFSVLTLPLVRGDKNTILNAPFEAVLSESAAKKYFGTTNCLHQTFTLDGKTEATVTGVMKDLPQNAHFRTDILLSMSSLFTTSSYNQANQDWQRFGFSTYVLLKENADRQAFEHKLTNFSKDYPGKENLQYQLILEPLKELYHHGSVRGNKAGATAKGNYNNIYIFFFVAFFVLCIACFNYINLTTALSMKRTKEIGVRQMIGATKKQLIVQFLVDAILLSTLAFLFSVMLCFFVIPLFNTLAGKIVVQNIWEIRPYLPYAWMIALFTGMLAGSYPAFFLSGFKPINTLKGPFTTHPKGLMIRRSLVVIQFAVFILLAVATIIIYRQLDFMKNEALGFRKAHNLAIDYHYDERINDHLEQVKADLKRIPGVEQAAYSAYIPGRPNRQFATTIEGKDGFTEEIQTDTYFVDYDFLDQYGIEILAGRPFSNTYTQDLRQNMLINETCLQQLGYTNPQDALGKRVTQRGQPGEIIGVVKDFQYHSMHEAIRPLTLQVAPGFFTFLTLTINSRDVPATIQAIEKRWKQLVPGLPLIYSFTDETLHAQYQAEERFGKLFISFAACALFISCLGLLGLVSFSTIQRTKEVGIRKVLGASSATIYKLLTKEYIVLVGMACLLAIPLTWLLMDRWLNDFAYRISIQWWMFFAASATAVIITLLSVSTLAIKTAKANPIDSLRDE